MVKLRILHISDLHERGDRENEGWRRRRVLGNAWTKNLEALCADGTPDLVCFTGDVANFGVASEYIQASKFFRELLAHLHMQAERLFIVPGNHDIQRKTESRAWRKLRKDLSNVPALEVSRWLSGGTPPPGFLDAHRDRVLRRQTAYREWIARDMRRTELLPDPSRHPYLGYRSSIRLPMCEFDVHIIGLDTAWLAGDDNDSGNLRLTTDQVMRLSSSPQDDALPGFRLALMHHPIEDLADAADCRRLLAERVDLVLRGHLHETETSQWTDLQLSLHQIAAGCLYEGKYADQYKNTCVMIDITLDSAGRPQKYELRFRTWSNRGHWFDDNSLYENSLGGRIELDFLQSKNKMFDIFLTYARCDADSVERLASGIRPSRSVWLDLHDFVNDTWQQHAPNLCGDTRFCGICIGKETPAEWADNEVRKAINKRRITTSFRFSLIILPGGDRRIANNYDDVSIIDFGKGVDNSLALQRLRAGIDGVSPGQPRMPHDSFREHNTRKKLMMLNKISDLVEPEVFKSYQCRIIDDYLVEGADHE